jgi:hypothetical protein
MGSFAVCCVVCLVVCVKTFYCQQAQRNFDPILEGYVFSVILQFLLFLFAARSVFELFQKDSLLRHERILISWNAGTMTQAKFHRNLCQGSYAKRISG